jgi:1,4-alpha-glucan branching enzyme
MSLKKQFVDDDACRVSFRYPKEAARDARTVCLAGEFNDWNTSSLPMKRQKCGDFQITITLPAGRQYQFRYFIDDSHWDNDWDADAYVPSPIGGVHNSLVIV